MQGGQLQQVDTPEAVYRDPASRAVAEFIGDNNVFSGRVTDGGSQLSVDGGLLPLPAGIRTTDGASVTLSIRPELLSIQEADQAVGGQTLSATVKKVEFLGDAYHVHSLWNDRTIVVKTAATTPPDGDVTLRFDAEAVHLI